MPVAMGPLLVSCKNCGWKKRVVARSDALSTKEVPLHCPECGSDRIGLASIHEHPVSALLKRIFLP